MPKDKAAFVTGLQQQGHVVAMVGDGINDSEALAKADVSIAMGKGSDIAMDVARMTLISTDLNTIPRAITLSRKTVTPHPPEPLLGLHLQHHRHPHRRRAAVPLQRVLAEPDDRRGGHGLQQRERGEQ